MLANDQKRLQIFLTMRNPYDYAEFKAACESAGADIMPWLEYTQKAETIILAQQKYPELEMSKAYLQVVKDNNDTVGVPIITNKNANQGCGGCGGGEVR